MMTTNELNRRDGFRRALIEDIRFLTERLNDQWAAKLDMETFATSTLRTMAGAMWEKMRAKSAEGMD